MNAEVLGEFEGIAREFDLTQESAQKVADIGVKLVQRIESQNTEAINALWTTWADQSRADTEFGGAAFEKNLALTRAARDRFGTPQFAALLKQSPLSNHPEMIRFLYRVGKATSEDTLVGGDGNGAVKPEAKTAAQVLYPEL